MNDRLTGSGNWTVPAGVYLVRVTLCGGGGGGSSAAGGTGGDGVIILEYTVQS